MVTNHVAGEPTSGRRSGSCVIVDLRFQVHVARTYYRPIRTGVFRLPVGHTFSTPQRIKFVARRISSYESRSLEYRS